MADRVGFLLWNYLEISGKPFGGYAIFFPGNLKRRIKPLSYCLDRVFRESRGRLIPLLVPINPLLPGGKALVHPACKQLPGVRGLLTTARTKIDRERWFPLNRIREYDGLRAMRGFFSTDLAHEGWVVSRPPAPGRPPSEKTGRTEWGLFLGTWALIVFPFFAAGRLPSVSIKRTFPFFFFLVAAVPLSMMFSLGTYQIGSWKNRSITERGLEALESLSAIDGEFSDVVSEFTQRTKSLLNTPGWLDRMSSADAATETGAVEEAFHFFASSPSPLDLVLIYKPGKFSRGYSKDKALNRRDRSALDFFAGLSRALIYRCNRDQPMEEIFPLTQVQRRFTQMVEEKKILSSGGFEDTSEIGSIVRITGSWRYLGIPKLYSENGQVKVSFVLLSKAELAFSRFLKGRIAQLDLEHPQERWTLARLLPGNEELIGPSPGNSYWSSSQGRLMRTVMIRAANFRAPVLLERNERIIAAAGCPNLGDFVIGREIPFSDLSSQAQKQALILHSGLFSIGVISMALGQRVVSSMIEPLTAVERGLQELTSGRFPPPLSLERDDELGEMTRSFDSMVSGLRQRLKLGRFVSGSLEESFHTGRNDAAETDGLVVRAVVLASDLRNFTTISEGNPPEIVVEMLNQHLEEMSDEIQRFGGRIDKFIGDAIIAVFTGSDYGSPAFRAVSAGIGMRRRHDRIQADRRAKGLFTYEMGVGIDSGEVFIGTIGSLGRSDFTVFGPPRERAESLEGASKKGTATRIMISSKIRSEAGSCLEAAPRSDGIFEVLGLSPRPGAQE